MRPHSISCPKLELGPRFLYPSRIMREAVHRLILLTAALLGGVLGAPVARAQSIIPATRPVVPVKFLDKAQGQLAIIDESSEPYFKLLQPMEMSAKTGSPIMGRTIEAEQDDCRRRYQQAVVDFTPQEMQAIEGWADRISRATQKSFPLFARTPWSFIKVRDGIEGSQPFTRGQHIVLPQSFISQIVHQEIDPAAKKHEGLLLVKTVHYLVASQLLVVRQSHCDDFAQMYQQLWQMVHVEKIEPGAFLIQHQFLTPGTVDQRWVYQIKDDQRAVWILPLQILPSVVDPTGQKVADAKAQAVRLEGSLEQGFHPAQAPNGEPLMEPLNNLPQFTSQFAPSHDKAFNPDVAAADLFWKIIVFEEMLTNPPPEAKAAIDRAKPQLAKPRQWFEKILAP
jgi:hypothetical protein